MSRESEQQQDIAVRAGELAGMTPDQLSSLAIAEMATGDVKSGMQPDHTERQKRYAIASTFLLLAMDKRLAEYDRR